MLERIQKSTTPCESSVFLNIASNIVNKTRGAKQNMFECHFLALGN